MNNWEDEIKLPDKTEGIEYAYYHQSSHEPIQCSEKELFDKIKNHNDIKYITTPDHKSFIIPGTDFETLKPVLKRNKIANISSLKSNAFLLIFVGIMFFLIQLGNEEKFLSGSNLLWIFVLLFPVVSNIYQILRIRNINSSNFRKEALSIKFEHWLSEGDNDLIYIFSGTLAAIFFFQLIVGFQESIEFAGLVKPDTNAGEYWRMLTATLMHGNFMHIYFNATAILAIGKTIIRISSFWYFAFVFLVSAIVGSAFSLLFYPDTTSVGASGGILGLIGYLLVLSFRMKNVPLSIAKSMIISIVMITLIGVSLPELIDNAAHGGGLLTGLLIGLIIRISHQPGVPLKTTKTFTIFGMFSTLILIAGVIMILKQFFENAG